MLRFFAREHSGNFESQFDFDTIICFFTLSLAGLSHKAVNLLNMIAGQLPGVVNEKISEKKTLLGVSLNVGTNK